MGQGPHADRPIRIFAAVAIAALALAWVLGAGTALRAHAAGPWFVDGATGSDGNDCLTAGSACKTIGAAIGKAGSGDMIKVAAGRYAETVEVTQPLILIGANRFTTFIRPSIDTDPAILIAASGVTLSGFTIDHSQVCGIRVNASDIVIRNNIVEENDTGICADSAGLSNVRIVSNTIQRNGKRDTDDDGDRVSASDTLVQDNIAEEDDTGMCADDADASNAGIESNNVPLNGKSDTGNGGIYFSTGGSAGDFTGIVITGNRVRDNTAHGIAVDNSTGTLIAGNEAARTRVPAEMGGRWRCRAYDIALRSSLSGTIANNNVHDGQSVGIALSGTSASTVQGNRVYGYLGKRRGIEVSGQSRPSLGNAILSNDIFRNATGISVLSGGTVSGTQVHFNRIVGNLRAGVDNAHRNGIDAINNWWGCSYGPGSGGAGCLVPTTNPADGTIVVTPWLTLRATVAPPAIGIHGKAALTADVTGNSLSVDTSALGHVPNGIRASFFVRSGSHGYVFPTSSPTLAGKAVSTYTAAGTRGVANLRTRVDQQVADTRVTIEETTVHFSSSVYSVTENTGSATITVTLDEAAGLPITVTYGTSDGTATAGSDYTSTGGLLVFAAGETTQTFRVPIINDLLGETDETITLTLSNALNAALGAPNPATLTILDDDTTPTIQFSQGAYSVTENAGAATLSVTLSVASDLTVTAHYTTGDGTAVAGSDYTPVSGTLTFAPGQTSQVISVPVINDTFNESTETFTLTLSEATNAILSGTDPVTVTILDDDPMPTIQFGSSTYTVTEAAGSAIITVTLNTASGQPVSVTYSTGGGSATPYIDYTPVSGTLAFAAGEITKTFSIPIANDSLPELDETVGIALSDPVNSTLGTPNPAVLILVETTTPTRFYLPFIAKDFMPAPDLIVDRIIASTTGITLAIKNQGDAPVVDAFWVDVYINPNPPPTHVNQAWFMLSSAGAVWGIVSPALPIEPGGVVTLTIGDPYYWPSYSSLPESLAPGTTVYAQADSVNLNTNYGGVLEGHEINGGPYNNISSTVVPVAPGRQDAGAWPLPGRVRSANPAQLPPR